MGTDDTYRPAAFLGNFTNQLHPGITLHSASTTFAYFAVGFYVGPMRQRC